MVLTELQEQFAVPGVLTFNQTEHGLTYVEVKTEAASATVFLQGAHLTHWQPAGSQPVLFLSPQTELLPGKAIRGGIPISFPWFAADTKQDRIDGKPGPAHGFARTLVWTLAFAAVVPNKSSGDEVHLSFTLGPTEISRALGFDHFRLVYQLTIGQKLTIRLTVANVADVPLIFEEALHTYFAVADVRRVAVKGLEGSPFVDKTEHFAVKPAADVPLILSGPTDRVYEHTTATCVIEDELEARRIIVEKLNSNTTVVFNPWKSMADLSEDQWPKFLCVETVNASESPVELVPGATHTMGAIVTVEAAK